jgi:hypothetical protein
MALSGIYLLVRRLRSADRLQFCYVVHMQTAASPGIFARRNVLSLYPRNSITVGSRDHGQPPLQRVIKFNLATSLYKVLRLENIVFVSYLWALSWLPTRTWPVRSVEAPPEGLWLAMTGHRSWSVADRDWARSRQVGF